jgi:hypothetical protein
MVTAVGLGTVKISDAAVNQITEPRCRAVGKEEQMQVWY